jgi:iron complex transport system substrate-binding protein
MPVVDQCRMVCFTVFVLLAGSAVAETKPRVASINACTDQLLWALADRGQIAALTRFSGDAGFSPDAAAVRDSGVRLIQGGAEDVLKLKADMVLAGSFTRAVTRERLARFGLRVETFPPAESIAAAKTDIARAGSLLRQRERAARLIAEIDAAIAETGLNFEGRSVLQLRRGGYVSGGGTLFGDIAQTLGAANAGAAAGAGVVLPGLETIIRLRADVLVIFDDVNRPGDQGAALFLHPALASVYPPSRRIVLPGNLITCAGPHLPELIRALSRELARVSAGRPEF